MADNENRSLIDQLEYAVETMLAGEPVILAPDPTMGALMGIASDLRDLPREEFFNTLARELEGKGEEMLATEKPVREGFRTVTPYIIVDKVNDMVEFVKQVFGAEETFRTVGAAGGFHIEVRVGDSMLMVGGGGQYRGPGNTVALHFFVNDVDASYQKALDAGATSLYPPSDKPYGVRDGGVKDVAGVDWHLSSPMKYSQGTLAPGYLAPYFNPKGADAFIDFVKRAFGAEEIEVHRDQNTVVHAKLRIQDSIFEVGEARGQWQPQSAMLFLYVDDADAWFNRAVAAGAKVVSPMADLPYGRSGGVEDGFGNRWFVCTPPEAIR